MEEIHQLNKNFFRQQILFGIMAFLTMSTTFTTVLVGGGAAQLQIPSLSAFMPSIQDAMGLDCAEVDASPNGECKQTIVQSGTDFTDCNDDNIDNCVANQTVDVNNVLNSNEDPRIAQSITQLLDCDNNIACENSVLNDASQDVDVDSAGSSVVDFDVAQTMTQTMAEGGQSNFDATNDRISKIRNKCVR